MTTAFFGSAGPAASPSPRPANGMSHTTAPVATHIIVQALSASQWRVCDTHWPEYDARSLLGFIEERAGHFEVVQIDSGLNRYSFGSLVEATCHF
ncbi:MAG: hypothetical protein ABI053_04185, partial [Lacisediminihabitans sp.]